MHLYQAWHRHCCLILVQEVLSLVEAALYLIRTSTLPSPAFSIVWARLYQLIISFKSHRTFEGIQERTENVSRSEMLPFTATTLGPSNGFNNSAVPGSRTTAMTKFWGSWLNCLTHSNWCSVSESPMYTNNLWEGTPRPLAAPVMTTVRWVSGDIMILILWKSFFLCGLNNYGLLITLHLLPLYVCCFIGYSVASQDMWRYATWLHPKFA